MSVIPLGNQIDPHLSHLAYQIQDLIQEYIEKHDPNVTEITGMLDGLRMLYWWKVYRDELSDS